MLATALIGLTMSYDWREKTAEAPEPAPAPLGIQQDRVLKLAHEQPQLAVPLAAPQETRIAKCVDNGRVTYSASSECRGTSSALSIAASHGELEGGFSQYELQMLQSAEARVARNQAAADSGVLAQATDMTPHRAQCAALDQQIAMLDARSRMPISGYEQETIRAERAQARSKQFAVHC